MSKASRPRQKGFRTHEQPIIISGGSVTLDFDSANAEHYRPDNPERPTLYTGRGLRISRIELKIPGQQLRRISVSDGRCTVRVFGQSNKPEEDPITFDSMTGRSVLIGIDSAEYQRQDTGTTFKSHHSGGHKVKRLTIEFPIGGSPAIEERIPNGRCDIRIYDTHAR